ncbi:MAG: orotate phosphoribosyltransferase, partial [[Clostridium] scindens]
MDVNLRDLRSVRNPKVRIKIMQGHFARSHSHVNTYIDISTIKSRCDHAR